jgi:hypothetical protein
MPICANAAFHAYVAYINGNSSYSCAYLDRNYTTLSAPRCRLQYMHFKSSDGAHGVRILIIFN